MVNTELQSNFYPISFLGRRESIYLFIVNFKIRSFNHKVRIIGPPFKFFKQVNEILFLFEIYKYPSNEVRLFEIYIGHKIKLDHLYHWKVTS